MHFDPDQPEEWFKSLEELIHVHTQKMIVTNSILDIKNNESYVSFKEETCKFWKKEVPPRYPVNYPIPKYSEVNSIEQNFLQIYNSYKRNIEKLPLKIMISNLPKDVKHFIGKREVATIERLIELAQDSVRTQNNQNAESVPFDKINILDILNKDAPNSTNETSRLPTAQLTPRFPITVEESPLGSPQFASTPQVLNPQTMLFFLPQSNLQPQQLHQQQLYYQLH